jgi:hypothetical protein
MANPTAPTEAGGLAVDFLTDATGAARFKISAASNTVTGATVPGGYAGVATHAQAEGSFGFGDPVVVGAGVDSANVVRGTVADTDGVTAVRSRGLVGTPVSTLVSLASNVRSALPASPASGRSRVVVQADHANSVEVHVGSATVTVESGISLTSNSQPLPLDLGSAQVYAIAGGTARVRVLELG